MRNVLENLKELWCELTDNMSTFGIITEIFDLCIVGALLFLFFRSIRKRFNYLKIFWYVLGYIILLIATRAFNLVYLNLVMKYGVLVAILFVIILYSQEFRQKIDSSFHINELKNNQTSNEERNQIIDTLVNTAVYLSERKTGALITIEGQESLDSFINKSILIKSVITQELLTTLFYVGTATHDGAVIIRGNTIMCAGAYLPSTDRYDIPKSLGTRHRAAIGISEKCDAFTIVVSEETGKISVTRNGGIEIGLTASELKKLLETHIVIK